MMFCAFCAVVAFWRSLRLCAPSMYRCGTLCAPVGLCQPLCACVVCLSLSGAFLRSESV